ncbi:MAG: response regulator [Bacteroidota bacterium]
MAHAYLDRVVLIDDSTADLFLNQMVLEESGRVSQIDTYTYADEALAALTTPDAPPVDLILLDINMPRMNGFEFAEAYEAAVDLDTAPVILMLSTSKHEEDTRRAQQYACIRAYINKPFTAAQFTAVLEQHFAPGA